MSDRTTHIHHCIPSFGIGFGVWWFIWGAKGFWWGVLYGGFWPVWAGYRLAEWLAR